MSILAAVELFVSLGVLVFCALVPVHLFRSARVNRFNNAVAERLRWYHSPFNLNLKKEKYLFFQALRSKSILDGFSGVYKGLDFRLFELGNKVLAVEFRTREKFRGVEVVSKQFLRLRLEGLFWKQDPVQLEGVEFNSVFSVYSLNPKDAFYEFSPDEMAQLLDVHAEYGAFGAELLPGRVLIYCYFAPYAAYRTRSFWNQNNMSNIGAKGDVLLAFMEFAHRVHQILH